MRTRAGAAMALGGVAAAAVIVAAVIQLGGSPAPASPLPMGEASLGKPTASAIPPAASIVETTPSPTPAPTPTPISTMSLPDSRQLSTIGPMTPLLVDASATLLLDGRVLIAGGGRSKYWLSPLASAEIYDPVTNTFRPTGSMASARREGTATRLLDGRVLVAGGLDAMNRPLAAAEIYDPRTGVFARTGSMHVGRANHTATLLSDGRVLVAGGADTEAGLASAEVWDPKTGAFARTGSMSLGRLWASAVGLADGRVLVAGGYDLHPGTRRRSLSAVEIWDPATGRFTTATPMSAARWAFAAVPLPDGRILMAGAPAGEPSARTADFYDPVTEASTMTGELSTSGNAPVYGCLLPTGNVVVVSGDGIHVFDVASGKFGYLGQSQHIASVSGRVYDFQTIVALPDGRVLFLTAEGPKILTLA